MVAVRYEHPPLLEEVANAVYAHPERVSLARHHNLYTVELAFSSVPSYMLQQSWRVCSGLAGGTFALYRLGQLQPAVVA